MILRVDRQNSGPDVVSLSMRGKSLQSRSTTSKPTCFHILSAAFVTLHSLGSRLIMIWVTIVCTNRLNLELEAFWGSRGEMLARSMVFLIALCLERGGRRGRGFAGMCEGRVRR